MQAGYAGLETDEAMVGGGPHVVVNSVNRESEEVG